MRNLKVIVVALAATLVAVLGAASPAQAAEFSACNTFLGTSCYTRSVQAEGGNVYIFLAAPPVGACNYEVVDSSNGHVVAKNSYFYSTSRTINGLYSRYYVHLFGCPANASAHISG